MKKCLNDNGIVHQTSVPDNPPQNGRAERVNRSLAEKVRCMLIESGLHPSFWAEAAATAAFILNRTPKKSLNGRTPYKVWEGKKPDLSFLRVFGSKALAYVPKKDRLKLDPKATECRMLGYSSDQKAYRLYELKTGKIICSQDVKFFETRDPMIKIKPKSHALLPISESEGHNKDESTIHTGNNSQSSDEADKTVIQDQSSMNEESFKSFTEQPESNQTSTPKFIRQSCRQSVFPENKFKDCVVNIPIKKSRKKADSNELAFFSVISNDPEPLFLQEALDGPESEQWRAAINEEYNSLIRNKTWELVDLPFGRKPISVKWVFKRKRDKFTGTRYKARLVVRGFLQEKSIDFIENYAPVVKFVSLRILCASAVKHNLSIDHFDVDSAYLHGEIKEEIYIQQPEGLINPNFKTKVCKLNKALYGTKQAGRVWHEKIKQFLLNQGFNQSVYDQCIFFKSDKKGIIIVLIFVDDILVFIAK